MTAILAFILSPIGRWIGGAVIVLAIIGGIYMKGHSDGSSRVQAKWDAAVQAAIERGQNARSDAERDVGNGSGGAGGLSDDKLDRDRSPM